MGTGAIILCGGKSSRMGSDKATLPFGSELMLQRVVRLLGEVVDLENIVVVAASGQELPVLPQQVRVAHDLNPDRGPLEGLFAGLESLPDRVDAAYVTSCDVPLLVPAFVTKMFELAHGFEIAVPKEAEKLHPLSAVYSKSTLQHVRQLLDADRLRVRLLFDEARTRVIDVQELRSVDPALSTLLNLNFSVDYQHALRLAGISGECID